MDAEIHQFVCVVHLFLESTMMMIHQPAVQFFGVWSDAVAPIPPCFVLSSKDLLPTIFPHLPLVC
jgi:hypothetical protein